MDVNEPVKIEEPVELDVLTIDEFLEMAEYSTSIPTGTTIGKKWLCDINTGKRFQFSDPTIKPLWWTGEYTVDPDPKMVGIKWRKVSLVIKKG